MASMKKDFIVARIEAAQDGGPYVYVGFSDPRRVFTRGQLLDAIHGVAIDSYERAIDAHVKNLRRKIEPDTRKPRYVLTVHGIGYRFADG